MAPALSGLLVGTGSVLILRAATQYVVECYKDYSASAMSAVVVVRSLFAAFLPLAIPPMVRTVGLWLFCGGIAVSFTD